MLKMLMMALRSQRRRRRSHYQSLCNFSIFCIFLLCYLGQFAVQAADGDNEIVDLPESSDNLNDTFYLVDLRSSGNDSSRLESNSNNSSSNGNESPVTTTTSPPPPLTFVDDFWDSPPPPPPPSSVITTLAAPESRNSNSNNVNNENDMVNMVTFRVTVTSTPAPVTSLAPSTTNLAETESSTRRPSSTVTTPTTAVPSSTVAATLRLRSNTVTVKPNEAIRVYSAAASTTSTTTISTTTTTPTPTTTSTTTTTTTTRKPSTSTTKRNKNKVNYSFNSVERIPVAEEGTEAGEEADSSIWKMTLHGTNMNSEELRMCNRTLLAVHFKPYSRRKVARQLKKDLDRLFSAYHYRFSVLVQTTSRNTMGKALHGVWLSMSLNGVHYFITATYRIVDGPKLREEDLSRIEYWGAIHALGSANVTGYRRYNRISAKLKLDLDRQYGHGNVWSVVIVKNRYLVKARVLEDGDSRVEFSRLNGGHYIIWRGGQNIDDTVRNARYMSSGAEKDDEDTSEHSFREYNGSSGGSGRRRARFAANATTA